MPMSAEGPRKSPAHDSPREQLLSHQEPTSPIRKASDSPRSQLKHVHYQALSFTAVDLPVAQAQQTVDPHDPAGMLPEYTNNGGDDDNDDDEFSVCSGSSPVDVQRVFGISRDFRVALEIGQDNELESMAPPIAWLISSSLTKLSQAPSDAERTGGGDVVEEGRRSMELSRYTLRKRKEINYHPYTKMSWVHADTLPTNARDLRIDTSILKEPVYISPKSRRDSHSGDAEAPGTTTDEEYNPISIPENSMLTDSLSPPLGLDSDDGDGHGTDNDITPLLQDKRDEPTQLHADIDRRKHSARPRQRYGRSRRYVATPRPSRNHWQKGEGTRRNSEAMGEGSSGGKLRHSSQPPSSPSGLPDIESLLAPRPDKRSSQSLPLGHSSDLDTELEVPVAQGQKRRRLVVSDEDDEDDDGRNPRGGTQSPLLDASGYYVLSGRRRDRLISKRSIRGVLPMSFMRQLGDDVEVDSDSSSSSSSDRRGGRAPREARKAGSAPSSRPHDARSPSRTSRPTRVPSDLFDSDYDDNQEGPRRIHCSQPPVDSRLLGPGYPKRTAMTPAQLGFLNIFEWQYGCSPAQMPKSSAPDFLRVAARELRRKRAKGASVKDDPHLKHFRFGKDPVHIRRYRSEHSDLEGELVNPAVEVLEVWLSGLVDVRHVCFARNEGDLEMDGGELSSDDDDKEEGLTRDSSKDDSDEAVMVEDSEEDSDVVVIEPLPPLPPQNRQSRLSFPSKPGINDRHSRHSSPSKGDRSRRAAHRGQGAVTEHHHRRFRFNNFSLRPLLKEPARQRQTRIESDGSLATDGQGRLTPQHLVRDAQARQHYKLPPPGGRDTTRTYNGALTGNFVFMSDAYCATPQPSILDVSARPRRVGPSPGTNATGLVGAIQGDNTTTVEVRLGDGRSSSDSGTTHPEQPPAARLRRCKLIADSDRSWLPNIENLDDLAEKIIRSRASTGQKGHPHTDISPQEAAARPDITSPKSYLPTDSHRHLLRHRRKATPTRTHGPLTNHYLQQKQQQPKETSGSLPEYLAQLKEFQDLTMLPSGVYFPHQSWIGKGRLASTVEFFKHLGRMVPASGVLQVSEEGCARPPVGVNYCGLELSLTTDMDIKVFVPFLRTWCQRWRERLGQVQERAGFRPEEILADLDEWTQFIFCWVETKTLSDAAGRGEFSVDQALAEVQSAFAGMSQQPLQPANAAFLGIEGNLEATAFTQFHLLLWQLMLILLANVWQASGSRYPRAVGGTDETAVDLAARARELRNNVNALTLLLLRATNWGVLWACRTSGPAMSSWQEVLWTSLANVFTPEVLHPLRELLAAGDLTFWPVLEATLLEASGHPQHGDDLDTVEWGCLHWMLPLSQFSLAGVAEPTVGTSAVGLHRWVERIVERHARSYHVQVTKLQESQRHGMAEEKDQMVKRRRLDAGLRATIINAHTLITKAIISVPPSSQMYTVMCRLFQGQGFMPLTCDPQGRLARYLSHYSGVISYEVDPRQDSCLMVALKAFCYSAAQWSAHHHQLVLRERRHTTGTDDAASRMSAASLYLRDFRSLVSRLLPTLVVSFSASGTKGVQPTYNGLSNHYAFFLIMQHCLPPSVVSPVRLVGQFMAVLKYAESQDATARRIFLEYWYCLCAIIACKLDMLAARLDRGPSAQQDEADGLYRALIKAIEGWNKAASVSLEEVAAAHSGEGRRYRPRRDAPEAVRQSTLVHALDYAKLLVVYKPGTDSQVSVRRALTICLCILKQQVLEYLVDAFSDRALPAAVAESALELVEKCIDVRDRLVDEHIRAAAVQAEKPASPSLPLLRNTDAVNSQPAEQARLIAADEDSMDVFDDIGMDMDELLLAVEAAAETERRALQSEYADIDREIAKVCDTVYIPRIRSALIRQFVSTVVATPHGRDNAAYSLVKCRVGVLVKALALCVAANLRSWEGLVTDFGKDSLKMIPDRYGCRLAQVLFSIEALKHAPQDDLGRVCRIAVKTWFSSIADTSMEREVGVLTAALAKQPRHVASVFSRFPVPVERIGDDLDFASLRMVILDSVLSEMEDQINSLDPSARQTSEIFQSYAVYIQILIASLKECYELGNLAWGSPAHMRFVSMAEHMLEMIRSRCASIIFAAQGIIQISPDMFPWQASSGGTLL